jgi:hypothetical protein
MSTNMNTNELPASPSVTGFVRLHPDGRKDSGQEPGWYTDSPCRGGLEYHFHPETDVIVEWGNAQRKWIVVRHGVIVSMHEKWRRAFAAANDHVRIVQANNAR